MGESNENRPSNEELLAQLAVLCARDSVTKAEIVTYLIEIDRRRLHLRDACTSMFDFCTRKMNMSKNTAFLRIAAMKLARRHPCILAAITRGDLHLSTLMLIRKHLTESNVESPLAEVSGKSYRDVEVLLAARAPKRDIVAAIIPVPEQIALPSAAGGDTPVPPKRAARIAPLSASRFELRVTVSEELRDKVEHAQDLMRHRNPNGDLEVILDCALDALLKILKKERLGAVDRPRRSRGVKPGAISDGARREVFERDGEQCTFVAPNGDRCPARCFLELDHITARALGGEGDPSNIRVLCKPHNRLHAEDVFGQEHVERAIHSGRRESSASEGSSSRHIHDIDSGRGESAASAELENTGVDAGHRESLFEGASPEESVTVSGSGRRESSLSDASPTATGSAVDSGRRECRDERARALSGLVHLGFKRGEATRALDEVLARRGRAPTSRDLPDVLREAIGILT